MHPIPKDFARRMNEVYGTEGAAWLERLPRLIADCERRWQITVGPPYALSYNYVAPAVRADGTPVVLKIGFPSREVFSEMDALRLYDGHGIARLLEHDREQGAMLLERLIPGTPLVELGDDERATTIAAQVMRQLWRPVPVNHPFRALDDWTRGIQRLRAHFDGGTGPLPRPLVEQAETLFAELLGSMTEQVLLHGDLHHWNILAAERQPWLAIDPKGIVGEPAYEVGAWLRNPLPWLLEQPHPGKIMARRVDQLAMELAIDRVRIRNWGLAQAVLSAWWSIEDHGYGWEPAIACAELLAAIKD